MPTQLPTTPSPTLQYVRTVSTEDELKAAITNDTTIDLAGNITLSPAGESNYAIDISRVKGLVINGNGFSIGFDFRTESNGGCFLIEKGTEVTMNDLTIKNGTNADVSCAE